MSHERGRIDDGGFLFDASVTSTVRDDVTGQGA